jgi:pteridine reductase
VSDPLGRAQGGQGSEPGADAPVALVTGGARRLGAAIVRSFTERGYRTVMHFGASAAEAEALVDELRSLGRVVVPVQADLADATAPAQIVGAAMDAFGRLDVVVSSASLMRRQPIDAVTPADWDAVAHVNLRAPFFLAQAAARVLSHGGVFVQVADHMGSEAVWPEFIPHQVTKAALPQLVATFAAAFAPRLRFNAVAPGLVLAPETFGPHATERFLRDVPLARRGTPEDVVQAIHFLVAATYITGVTLHVDGGRHLWR